MAGLWTLELPGLNEAKVAYNIFNSNVFNYPHIIALVKNWGFRCADFCLLEFLAKGVKSVFFSYYAQKSIWDTMGSQNQAKVIQNS